MKVNRLEAHDRLLHYQKQQQDMGQAVFECIKNVPDDIKFPFYVYGHSRSVGDFSAGGQKQAYDKMQELKNRLRI